MKSHSTNSSFMYVQIISKRQIQVYNESDETSNSPTTIRDTRRRYTTNANWNFVEIRKKQTKQKDVSSCHHQGDCRVSFSIFLIIFLKVWWYNREGRKDNHSPVEKNGGGGETCVNHDPY